MVVARGYRRSHESLGEGTGTHASARACIAAMCDALGLDDLGGVEVLDYGCGVKFTQAILDDGLPIGRYVGVDTYREMIEALQAEVDDPRFEHHHIDSRNALYNPGGAPLSSATELPLGGRRFDLVCLFSVFTHLDPHDYRALLEVLRRHVRDDGRCFFTLYVNETTPGGHGYIDAIDRAMRANPALLAGLDAEAAGEVPDFFDADPQVPLKNAVYSRRHALELVAGTGWGVVELRDPVPYVQHQMVLQPC